MTDLDHFYQLLGELETRPGQGRLLSEYSGGLGWPNRGVYFFREPGESRSGSTVPRIVRVGTHAVSANSKSTLWGRLRTHRGYRSGGGNHRGSIFRLHVGAALLARERVGLTSWGVGSSAAKEIRATERDHEQHVSALIGAMSVLWLDVPDEPGVNSNRSYIERNTIALLSNALHPIDRPSAGWLGSHSSQDAIRMSGLWNLQHVHRNYEPRVLNSIATLIEASR